MSARRSVLAALIAGIVFISAAPAWAVYTKFVDLKDSHVDGMLKITGKLILNDNKNPTPLPADGEKCPKNRTVEIQKRRAEGGWKEVGTTSTDSAGNFSDKIEDKGGRYRLVAPEAMKGKALCYKARKNWDHEH